MGRRTRRGSFPGREVVEVGEPQRSAAGAGDRVDHRELDLVLVGPEVDEQGVDRIEHLRHPGILAIDLVHHHHERLAEDETGLRKRSLGGVDEEQDSVDQAQPAFHLAAEVGVAGGIDDVDLHPAVVDRRVLREDGDPLLPLEIA